jgi:hypothetical protein
MKRKNLIVYIGLASIIFFGILIYSCSKESPNSGDNSQIPDEVINEICSTCESYPFWLPDKTEIEKVEDKDENQIVFTAPEGYIYYGFASDSSLIIWDNKEQGGGSVTVTCDCTNGSDDNCSPVGHNGTVNCVISAGCTTCKRKEKATDPVTKTEYEILSGGFVNPSLGVSFAQPDEELPYAFKALLFYPEIKQQLDEFMLQFYADLNEIPEAINNEESLVAPEGYKFIVLNVYGRALVTIIPESKGINSAGGHTYTCPCNGTSGICEEDSFMGYHYCEKPDSNPCDQACNTMTVEDDKKKTVYTYTYYFF